VYQYRFDDTIIYFCLPPLFMPDQSDIYLYNQVSAFITSGSYTIDQSNSGNFGQLSRIDSLAWGVEYPLENETYIDSVNKTSLPLRPTVNCTLGWKVTNGYNEGLAGFLTNGRSGAFLPLNDQRDLYIVYENDQGRDSINSVSSNKTIVGVGQILLSDYSISAEAGGVIDATATFNGLTAVTYTGVPSGLLVPSVDPLDGEQLSGLFTLPAATSQYGTSDVLSPNYYAVNMAADIDLDFIGTNPFGTNLNQYGRTLNLKSFRASFSFPRSQFQRLGSVFPDNRPITYPIEVTLDVEATITNRLTQKLTDMGCMTTGVNVNLLVNKSCTSGLAAPIEMSFIGMNFRSQGSSLGLSGPETASFQLTSTISNPYSSTSNVFFRDHNILDLLVGRTSGTSIDYGIVTSWGEQIRVY
jgi:hypothetical protein